VSRFNVFGKNPGLELPQHIDLIRAIPGDIFKTENDRLKVTFFQIGMDETADEIFDMVVLSIGIGPCDDMRNLSKITGINLEDTGFAVADNSNGIFITGTAAGPMSIAESISDAGRVAWKVAKFLKDS